MQQMQLCMKWLEWSPGSAVWDLQSPVRTQGGKNIGPSELGRDGSVQRWEMAKEA